MTDVKSKKFGRLRQHKRRIIRYLAYRFESKGWEYCLPHTNLPKRWSKEIRGEVIWAYPLERNGRFRQFTFERRSDAIARRLALPKPFPAKIIQLSQLKED